jgi:hypothetical protein
LITIKLPFNTIKEAIYFFNHKESGDNSESADKLALLDSEIKQLNANNLLLEVENDRLHKEVADLNAQLKQKYELTPEIPDEAEIPAEITLPTKILPEIWYYKVVKSNGIYFILHEDDNRKGVELIGGVFKFADGNIATNGLLEYAKTYIRHVTKTILINKVVPIDYGKALLI